MPFGTLQADTFRTPAGHPVTLEHRFGTSDWNTLSACLDHDEYGLPSGQSGVFVDVGAHIGGWAVGAAIDNPDATVVAIEALPENVEVLRRNTANLANVTVLERAAGDGSELAIGYGPTDTDFGRHTQYIGSAERGGDTSVRQAIVEGISLAEIVAIFGPIRMLKIDCEGCEYPLFLSRSLPSVDEISGEVHFGWQRLVDLLDATHEVTGEGKDFGAFRAVRR